MNQKKLQQFETQLQEMVDRMQRNVSASMDEARSPNSEMSNAPTHLGDLGTDEYLRDVNSVLVENETNLLNDALAALRRIREGVYGRCENCGKEIARERLEVLPSTPYCTDCAGKLERRSPNLNDGRPQSPADTLASSDDQAVAAENATQRMPSKRTPRERVDIHAAGTPGGGTAVGGLAGSPEGRGDPTGDLEDAMGSSDFDARTAPERDAQTPTGGPTGGAVGGTPAGKRADERSPRQSGASRARKKKR